MPYQNLKIKVCGMKYSENITELLFLQPDYVGFIFYEKSPRFISTQVDVFSSVFPKGTQKVGVFVDEEASVILQKVTDLGLGMVQLHGHESPKECQELRESGLTVMKAFRVGAGFDFSQLQEYAPSCDYFLFDASGENPGGNGVRFNWELLKEYQLGVPFFLSGGIDLEHIAEIKALRLPQLYGLDLNSKFEIQPGLKDINRLKQFFEEIKA
ncbi:phosphoribosylanthranilate isomerase [Rufibacter latericius]|uniref:N-(5'-phosphoribosyl)anthranilate isomerase n=1 Tax=Rufibacter latericius TaxID=2487040 RepID=A0A3M9MY85_9BACT|nr:phosphoribosylanthranilate isomerase [Rufibacter latericius]RNI30466.1 phosphoribosylanthranilate isomerase [Rufibacter latericius]